jgi:hypothetical protein
LCFYIFFILHKQNQYCFTVTDEEKTKRASKATKDKANKPSNQPFFERFDYQLHLSLLSYIITCNVERMAIKNIGVRYIYINSSQNYKS